MRPADIQFLHLLSTKTHLTFGDMRECLALYTRNTSIFNRFSRFYTKSHLPLSIYELKQIMLQTGCQNDSDILSEQTLTQIRDCIMRRTERNSRSTRNPNSCSSIIFTYLTKRLQLDNDPQPSFFGKIEVRNYQKLTKELINYAKKHYRQASFPILHEKLMALSALADGTWNPSPGKNNIYLGPGFSTGYGYLQLQHVKTNQGVKACIDNLLALYYTGYHLAQRLGQLKTYFSLMCGADCLAKTSESISTWITKNEGVQQTNYKDMHDFMTLAQTTMPAKIYQAGNPKVMLDWYTKNYSGVLVENEPVTEANFRQYMIEIIGYSEEDFYLAPVDETPFQLY